MKIGYIVAGFPTLSETFVANDVRGLEALGHEVTVFSLGPGDPAALGNPNYQTRGKTIRVRGLAGNSVVRKITKVAARRRLRRKHGERFSRTYDVKPAGMPEGLWLDRKTWVSLRSWGRI